MKHIILALAAFGLVALYTSAQHPEISNQKLMLQTGVVNTTNNTDAVAPVAAEEIYNGRYYRIIQFEVIPDNELRNALQSAGITLLNYIPYYAYFASIREDFDAGRFGSLRIKTVLPVSAEMKLSRELFEKNFPSHAISGNEIDLLVRHYDDVNAADVIRMLPLAGAKLIRNYDGFYKMHVRIPVEKIDMLAELPVIKHIEAVSPPSEPEDTKGRTMHRSSLINTEDHNGLHFNGDGVSISLADDGEVGPHIDFTGRLTDIDGGGPGGTHGDMTSGIAAGAGNLDPTKRGMADGAHLYIHDISGYDHIYDALLYYADYHTVITSTSYSQGCNEYNNHSEAGDQLVYENPQFSLVFSAGNNSSADCGYGAGDTWGTITGGFKQGKNVIAVANLDAYDILSSSSSRGPASDGRLKPDISANGKDQQSTDENNTYQVGGGTSAACPGIAGITAQLYQAYKQMHGDDPNSALIKAALLNTAEDIGNPGPDFTYGWGRVNALRAYNLLSEGRYILDSLQQGNTNTHQITVPANVREMKVMVYWLDEQGDPQASVALVNDLDFTLTSPNAVQTLPWILDPTPTVSAITADAVRGVDHLNNMEQVTLSMPAAGTYTATVSGTMVPSGVQQYFLVWEFRTEEIFVVYPNGHEGVVPGLTETVRWDASGNTGTFAVEYSTNQGGSWNTIGGSVNGSLRHLQWSVPGTITDEAIIRVTRNGVSDVSDANFVIAGRPSNLNIDWVCSDTLQISWNPVPGITTYEVSMLGSKYMDSVATVSATFARIAAPDTLHTWMSVRTVGDHGGKGRRAIAIEKLPGIADCAVANDMSVVALNHPAPGVIYDCGSSDSVYVIADIKNNGLTPASGFQVSYSVDGGTPVVENYSGTLAPSVSVLHTFAIPVDLSSPGNHSIQVSVIYATDQNMTNNQLTASYTSVANVIIPVTETFGTGSQFPPNGWSIESTHTGYQWRLRNVTGSGGVLTNTAWFDNYLFNSPGTEDHLLMIMADMTGVQNGILTFDVAYAYIPTRDDALRIDASVDCGLNFLPAGYYKAGSTLATVNPNSSYWMPTTAQHWRTDTVDLSAYAGEYLQLRFTNINNHGNNLYIDNVNISDNMQTGISSVTPGMISIFPNPSQGMFTVSPKNLTGPVKAEVYDARGALIQSRMIESLTTIDLSAEGKGVYFMRLSNEEVSMVEKLVVR